MNAVNILLVGPFDCIALRSFAYEIKKMRKPTQLVPFSACIYWWQPEKIAAPVKTFDPLHAGILHAVSIRSNCCCMFNVKDLESFGNGGTTDKKAREFPERAIMQGLLDECKAVTAESFFKIKYAPKFTTSGRRIEVSVDGNKIEMIFQSQNHTDIAPQHAAGNLLADNFENVFLVGDAAGFDSVFAQHISGLFAAEMIKTRANCMVWSKFAFATSSADKLADFKQFFGVDAAKVDVPHFSFYLNAGNTHATFTLHQKIESLNICAAKNKLSIPVGALFVLVEQNGLFFDEDKLDDVQKSLKEYWIKVATRGFTADQNVNLSHNVMYGPGVQCADFVQKRSVCPELEACTNGQKVFWRCTLALIEGRGKDAFAVEQNTIVSEEKVEGVLVKQEGTNGFGFDRDVKVKGDKTLAQMTIGEKQFYSARLCAFASIVACVVQRERWPAEKQYGYFLRKQDGTNDLAIK